MREYPKGGSLDRRATNAVAAYVAVRPVTRASWCSCRLEATAARRQPAIASGNLAVDNGSRWSLLRTLTALARSRAETAPVACLAASMLSGTAASALASWNRRSVRVEFRKSKPVSLKAHATYNEK